MATNSHAGVNETAADPKGHPSARRRTGNLRLSDIEAQRQSVHPVQWLGQRDHELVAPRRAGHERGPSSSLVNGCLAWCQTVLGVSANDEKLLGDLRGAGDPEGVARSARALVTQAGVLVDQGSGDEALRVLDTVIDALDGSADMEPRKVLALALATKSATLKRLGRRHAMRPFEAMVGQYGSEAVDEFDEEAMRLWSAHTPRDRERLAWILLTEAMVLEHQNRRADAGATLKALLKRFDDETSPAIVRMLDAARHALEIYRKDQLHRPL